MNDAETETPIRISLPSKLGFYEAAATWEQCLTLLADSRDAPFVIDAQALEECDTAGLQLLAQLVLEARRRDPQTPIAPSLLSRLERLRFSPTSHDR